MRFRIQFEAKLPETFKRDEETGYIIACCPILDVITQGSNEAEARRNLSEAVFLFFISCYEHGTLDEVLKECGFSPLNPPQTEPSTEPDSETTIGVQIPFFSRELTAPTECQA